MADSNTQPSKKIDDQQLTRHILYAMLAAILLGCLYHEAADWNIKLLDWFDLYIVQGVFELAGEYFVRALKMIVVPLVFFSLIAGLTSDLDVPDEHAANSFGARAGYTFVLYLGTTMLAVTLALFLATLVDPGASATITTDATFTPPPKQSVVEILADFVPHNIFAAFASGNMLAVIFVSLLFGLAMKNTGVAGQRLGRICQDINEVVTKIIFMIMALAPYGVFALVFQVFAEQGVYFMASIAAYFMTVVVALGVHAGVIYSGIVLTLGRCSPLIFWRKMRQVMLFAFSTASSAATIGINLRNATERFGVRQDVGSFTIPLGATINMDGTAIMQGVAVVFIAGVYSYDLTLFQFVEVILLATLASVGTAAVPSAGLVTLSIVLVQVNLPAEAIGLIIGVDRLLDMLRTAVNVAGDAAITIAVGQREGAVDMETFSADN